MKRVISFFLALIMIISIATVSIAGAKSCSHEKDVIVKSRELLSRTTQVAYTTNCKKVPGHKHKHRITTEIYWVKLYCRECRSTFFETSTITWRDCLIR